MRPRTSKRRSKKTSGIQKAGGRAGAEQALEKKAHEYAEALTKHDVEALNEIWSTDYTFVNPRGELLGKAQRIANIKSGTTEFQTMRPQKERLHVQGNFAVEVGRIVVEGEYSGHESSGEYRYTTVWIKMQKRWRMLANQITLIAK
jgi:ketosteroid isomerase-like protein